MASLAALFGQVVPYQLGKADDGSQEVVEVVSYAACEGASVVVLATEWDEFRWLDFDKVGSVMARRAIVDARNLLDPAALRLAGFEYEGIGIL